MKKSSAYEKRNSALAVIQAKPESGIGDMHVNRRSENENERRKIEIEEMKYERIRENEEWKRKWQRIRNNDGEMLAERKSEEENDNVKNKCGVKYRK